MATLETAAFTGYVRSDDLAAYVMLAGEIDVRSAPEVQALLTKATATGAPVVVDMALVSFCDATGLGVLVRAANEMRPGPARLSVTGAPPRLRRLLSIVGLTEALQVAPANTEDGLLARDLGAAARIPLTRNVLDASLRLVAVMGKAVMAGADGVSITLPRDGQLRTVAASNDVVLQMDHDQYDTEQGPCIDAATKGAPFDSPALESEIRWPQFVPRARDRGIESIMSTPLMSGDRPLGALNVYSRAPHGLASHEQQWANQFAQEAARVLLAADRTLTADSVDSEIGEALRSRETIALAQGVIMTRQGIGPEAAHRFLTNISRVSSRPLLRICDDVVQAITAPTDRKPDGNRIADEAT